MGRPRARRRPKPRNRDGATGDRVFRGPTAKDAVSGFTLPIEDMVPQRGGLVSRKYSDGTRDRPDKSNW